MRAFRTSRVAAVAAGMVLLLGACGEAQNAGDRAGDDAPPATTAPSEPTETTEPDRQPARTPPAGGTELGAEQIDATALPEGYPQLVWTENDGRTIGAVAQEGGCGKATLEVGEQTESQVVVTMVEIVPSEPQACTMDLRYPKLTVELDAPLAERQVALRAEQRER